MIREGLPSQMEVFQRAVQHYSADPRAFGVFLKGSFARGDHDQFSDIDLHVLISDDAYPPMIDERPALMRTWGNVLCEWGSQEHQRLCLYDNGVVLEVDFHRPDWLSRPRHGVDLELCILHDPQSTLAAFKGRCAAMPMSPEVDAARLAYLWQQTWAWLWTATGKSLRGEVWECFSYLEAVRETAILPVYRTLRSQAPIGYRRIEGWAEEAFLRRLETTVFPTDKLGVVRALIALTELFAELATDLARTYGVPLPAKPTETRQLVEQALGQYQP